MLSSPVSGMPSPSGLSAGTTSSKALSVLGLEPATPSDDAASIRTRSSGASTRSLKLLRTPSWTHRSPPPPLPNAAASKSPSYLDLAPSPGATSSSFAHSEPSDYLTDSASVASSSRSTDRRPSTSTAASSTYSAPLLPPASLPTHPATRFDLTQHLSHSSVVRRFEATAPSSSFLKRLGGGLSADQWVSRRVAVTECGRDAALHVFRADDASQLAIEMDRLRLTPRSVVTVTDDPHGGAYVLRISGLPLATYELERVWRLACSNGSELGAWLTLIKAVIGRLRGDATTPPPPPTPKEAEPVPIARSQSDGVARFAHPPSPPSLAKAKSREHFEHSHDLGALHPFAAAAFERDGDEPIRPAVRTRPSAPPGLASARSLSRRSTYDQAPPGADMFARAPLPPPPPPALPSSFAPSPSPPRLRRPQTAPTPLAPLSSSSR